MRLKIALIFAVVLIFVPLLLPLVIGFGKTGKKTTILGRDYSLLTKPEILQKIYLDFPLPPALNLTYTDRQFSFDLATIFANLDTSHLANSLLFRRLNQGLGPYITAFFAPKDYTLDFTYDHRAMAIQLEAISSQVNRPFIPSEVFLDSANQPQVKEGQLGFEVDQSALESLILSSLNHYQLSEAVP